MGRKKRNKLALALSILTLPLVAISVYWVWKASSWFWQESMYAHNLGKGEGEIRSISWAASIMIWAPLALYITFWICSLYLIWKKYFRKTQEQIAR